MTKRNTATKEPQPDLLGGNNVSAKDVDAFKAADQAKAKPVQKVSAAGTVVAMPRSRTLVDFLQDVVRDKKADVGKVKEVLAMIREEQDRQAAQAFNTAMLAAQTEMPTIKRDSKNKHTGSFWAKLEKISKAVDPISRRHGFTLSYGMATSPLAEHYRIVCDVAHTGGHVRRYDADVGMDHKGPKGEGNKSLAQGSGSSVTYARRFLKVMIFDIVIEGMDDDGNGGRGARVVDAQTIDVSQDDGPKISVEQHDNLVEAIEACGATRAQVCKGYRIEKLADLPASAFAEAMESCRLYALKHGKGGK